MKRYQIEFWNTPNTEIIHIEAQSSQGVIDYLWNNEKDRIYKIMKINSELTLWRNNESVLLWNNEYSGSLWFDVDNYPDSVSRPPFKDGYCLLPEIGIDQLSFKQFTNLIKLMLELMDDYGGNYISIYEQLNGDMVDIDTTMM